MIPPDNNSRMLLNRMILHSMDNHDALGLFNGQMGVTLVVAHCVEQWSAPELETAADFLFTHISNNINRIPNLTFSSGLSGICWGIEYLTSYGLMPGPAHDICMEADNRIMELDIRRIKDFSIENGIVGLWYYVQSRIQGNLISNLSMPFDDTYLADWLSVISQNPKQFPLGTKEWLISALRFDLKKINMSLLPFINHIQKRPENNLSLHNGIAGYIATKYLVNI